MVDKKVSLPPRATEAGAVARLLLAEVQSPSFPDYNAATALATMQKMKLVLSNRLANNPKQYGADGAKNLIDIIAARTAKHEQFAGFRRYPHYKEAIAKNIQDQLDIANAQSDSRSAAFATHVANAILVANSPVIKDPSPTYLDGWRTTGYGAPSSDSVAFETIGNNTFFYTRRKK